MGLIIHFLHEYFPKNIQKRDMQNAHPLTQFANIEENNLTTTLLPQKE